MLNDVIGFTSYQTFLDVHLLPESSHTWTKILAILFWIGMSVVLGYSVGLVTALLCKFTSESEKSSSQTGKKQEISNTLYSVDFGIMFLSPWIAYLIAEVFDMSAILTIFFCGLSLGQYAMPNLNKDCRLFTEKAYEVISGICDSISFIYIGVSFFGFGMDSP